MGKLFRAPELYRGLRRQAFPRLRTYPSVAVWVPACGAGDDAYALAIALREEGLLDRTRLYATDADEGALAVARRGDYPLAEVRAAEAAYRDADGRSTLAEYYEEEGGRARMRPALRDHIATFAHDLGWDASFREFQLVYCGERFLDADPLRLTRAYEVCHASLARFGLLAVAGGGELAHHLHARCYEAFGGVAGLFRRVR